MFGFQVLVIQMFTAVKILDNFFFSSVYFDLKTGILAGIQVMVIHIRKLNTNKSSFEWFQY